MYRGLTNLVRKKNDDLVRFISYSGNNECTTIRETADI